MTSPIVDVDTFTAPVTAPDDGDPLDVASIRTTALQALSNRTLNLLNLLRSFQIATLLQVLDQHDLTVVSVASPDSIFHDGSFLYCTGASFSGGVVRSEDGVRDWRNPSVAAGATTANVVAGDGAGVVVAGHNGGELTRSTDFGDNWAVAEAAASITPDDIIAITWSAANSLFVIISATDEIFTSPTGANGTWTLRVTPGGAAGLTGRFAIALSGASSGRLVMANVAGAMHSDDAITWTQVNFTGGGANFGACVGWTDVGAGSFLLGTGDGETWIAADASAWTMLASDVGPTVGGTANDAFGVDMISNLDGIWVALFNATGATAKASYVYSVDGGTVWRIAPYDGANAFQSILFALSRFYFGALGNSGQIFSTPTVS